MILGDDNAGKADAADRAGKEAARPAVKDATKSLYPKAISLDGSWRVEGQELVQSGGEGTILLGEMTLSSFNLSFQGQIVSGNEGFVTLFHRTSDDTLRFLHVGELGGKRADLGFLSKGKEGGKEPKAVSIVKGHWYKVLVKVRDAESWCYLDGQELFHDIDERYTKGRIGLATWDSNARFRDIAVTTPEGKPLWIGPPDCMTDSGGKVIWEAAANPPRQPGGERQAAARTPGKSSDKPASPAAVSAGSSLGAKPPEGAVVVFNGRNMDGWVKTDGKTPAGWPVTDGFMTVGRGNIMTEKRFGDFQLHLEFKVPYMPTARGQARGNSGVFLGGTHELQILDSYKLKPENNDCGAIYKQVVPAVNACKPPLQWQTYDVTFHKARIEDGKVVQRARVTVIQNGLRIIDDAEISPTPGGGIDLAQGQDGPILLQDHRNPVEFRNIWIRPLN